MTVMNFGNMSLPLGFWDTMSLKFTQRLINDTLAERIDWTNRPVPWKFGFYMADELRQMHRDLQEIIDKHGSPQTLDEWLAEQ